MRRARGAVGLGLLLVLGCQRRPAAPPPRPPQGAEVSAETVVVNYGPLRLRVLPGAQADERAGGQRPPGRYVIMATEYPQLHATWRPLGVIDKAPPPGFLARAGDFVWLQDRVVETAVGDGGGRQPLVPAPGPLQVLVYDRDGRKAVRTPLALPGPCTATRPALLQADSQRVYGALGCAEGPGYALELAAGGAVRRAVLVPEAGGVEGYARWPAGAATSTGAEDEEYLLAGRRLWRLRGGQVVAEAALASPLGGGETRALLLDPVLDEVLVVDGAAGRVRRFARDGLKPRGDALAFDGGPRVERLRALLQRERLLLVAAERDPHGGTELWAAALPLRGGGPRRPARVRVASDSRPVPSNHELVPADGSGALLVWTHAGTTGPLVALLRLNL